MNRILGSVAIAAVLCFAIAAPAGAAMPLGMGRIGVGAYGVTAIPIAQDDAGVGTVIGARVRVGLTSVLGLEGSFTRLSNGDKETDGITFEGPTGTNFSVNGMLRSPGMGFAMYLTGGIGTTKLDVPGGVGEDNKVTYNFGIGAEIGLGPLSLDLSPRLFVIKTEDGVSRKDLAGMAGLTYYLN